METCISCNYPLVKDIILIGDQFPSAIFVDKDNEDLEASSLNVTKCPNESCGLVQLSNKYNLDSVFDHYPYESGKTASMKQILQDVVDDTMDMVPLMSDDVVLDIGGNDGTLLSLISKPVRKVNIDAAAGINQVLSDPNYTYIHSKFDAKAYFDLNLPNPSLIFSIAMFYHLTNPLEFCRNVKEIMSDETVWVLQMTYLGTMLKNNVIDNIVHEHAAYYSLQSLRFLFSQVGLKIIETQIVNSYGGSLRIFVVKDHNYRKENCQEIKRFEDINNTNTFSSLHFFNARTQYFKESFRALIDHLVDRHGPMWGFGASTKGNMLLQFLGLNECHIHHILDNSLKKIGKKTSGSLIPIVSEIEYIRQLYGYVFVLPYYYIKNFIPIISANCIDDTYLIVPLPYPHFIEVCNE